MFSVLTKNLTMLQRNVNFSLFFFKQLCMEVVMFYIQLNSRGRARISGTTAGLEKSTHPLVFTSESSIRASGNLPWLARQDE